MNNIKKIFFVIFTLTSQSSYPEKINSYNAKNDPFINTTLKTEQEIFDHTRNFFFNTSCPLAKATQHLHVAIQALEEESKELEKLQKSLNEKLETNKREINRVNALAKQATLMTNTLVKADDYADQVRRDTHLASEKAKGGRGHFFGRLSLEECCNDELFAQNIDDTETLVTYLQRRFYRSPYPLAKGMELINTLRTSLHKEISTFDKKIERTSLMKNKAILVKEQNQIRALLDKANTFANKLARETIYKKQANDFYKA